MGHDRKSAISSKSDKDKALPTTHRVPLALATKCEILKTLNIEPRFLGIRSRSTDVFTLS